jgi:hypothetical protein
MIYIYDGDKVEINGVQHEVVDGELVEIDERTPLEKRLDEIESRLEKLENPAWQTRIWTSDPCPNTQPYTVPYPPYPGTYTWCGTDIHADEASW